jgi:CRISPR system Cascade subunit CasB
MMNEPTEFSPPPATIEQLVHRIAGLMRHGGGVLSSGDVSVLRRMDPHRLEAPFFKVAGFVLDSLLPGDALKREALETRWGAILVGLAHLGDLHHAGARLGRALAAAGLSEIRFSRVLRADGDRLVDELPSLARFLVAKGVPTDWSGAARLLLSSGRADEERTRRALARDYYGALARDANS